MVATICDKFNVMIMPCEYDLSDTFMPQQPFPDFCFPESTKKNGNITMMSNPAVVHLMDKQILISGGVNVNYLLGLTPGLKTEMDVLEMTLNARHFAPNSSLMSISCYPSKSTDKLVINTYCVFFIWGRSSRHSSERIKAESHPVKLLTVPIFRSTQSITLVDIETAESFDIDFNSNNDA